MKHNSKFYIMKTKIRLSLSLFLGAIIASCGVKNEKSDMAAGPQLYPVFTVSAYATNLDTDYPATIQGIQNIDIRPKVDGFID